jgi:hypothetical protein
MVSKLQKPGKAGGLRKEAKNGNLTDSDCKPIVHPCGVGVHLDRVGGEQ